MTKKAKHIAAVKIKGRYMRFVDCCLLTQKFNTLELNFFNWFLQRSDACVETSVYPQTALTDVARLISNCTLTDRLPHQTLPQLKFQLIIPGRKECTVFRFHPLMTWNLVSISIPFSPLFQ